MSYIQLPYGGVVNKEKQIKLNYQKIMELANIVSSYLIYPQMTQRFKIQ